MINSGINTDIMFDKALDLRRHLDDYGFFNGNTELYIIDDYHLNGIKERKTMNFYIDAFANSGVKTIVIFIQVRNYRVVTMNEVRNYCNNNNLDYSEYISFQTLVNIPIRRKIRGRFSATAGHWNNDDLEKMEKNSNIAIEFIRQMKNVGINVLYRYYDNLNFRPPFHGRYWITPVGKGLIVDGSLNTIENDLVFAQRMDEENYDIIYNLYRNKILRNAEPYAPMTDETIEKMLETMKKYYNIED